jgi:hypothetical protein
MEINVQKIILQFLTKKKNSEVDREVYREVYREV